MPAKTISLSDKELTIPVVLVLDTGKYQESTRQYNTRQLFWRQFNLT